AFRSRLLRLPMRSLFPMTLENPELLPRAGADCPTRRRLTKTKEEETIIINRSGRSTYPEEKSVSRSGATPALRAGHREAVYRLLRSFCRSRSTHPNVAEIHGIVPEVLPLRFHPHPLFVNDTFVHLSQGPSGFERRSHMVANQVNVRFNGLGFSLDIFE